MAKAKPGSINYASYGSGSQPHLAGEMLKNRAGIDLVHVPYKGISLAVPAVIAGEVQLTFAGIATSMPQLKAGRIKALATGGAERSPLLPQVPTFAELGFPEVETHAWFGLFLPAGSPRQAVARIDQDTKAILEESDFRQKQLLDRGYEVVGSRPKILPIYLNKRQRKPRTSGENLGGEGGIRTWKRFSSNQHRVWPSRWPATGLSSSFSTASAVTGATGPARSISSRRTSRPPRGTRAATAIPTITTARCSSTTSPATCCASRSISRPRKCTWWACRWAGASRATSRCAPRIGCIRSRWSASTPGFDALSAEGVRRFVTERASRTPQTLRRLLGSRASSAAYGELLDSVNRIHEVSYQKTLQASVAQDRAAPIEKIRVPTLIIAGEEDKVYPPELARDMAKRIPGAELLMFSGAGHLVEPGAAGEVQQGGSRLPVAARR